MRESKPKKGKKAPSSPEYSVGRGRPPQQSQFRPGQSGNPSGRPKGRKNFATIVAELANELVIVTEGGKPRRVPRFVALHLKLWAQAFNGNSKAWAAIQQSLRDVGLLRPEQEHITPPLEEADKQIVADFVSRFGTPMKTSRPKKTKKPN